MLQSCKATFHRELANVTTATPCSFCPADYTPPRKNLLLPHTPYPLSLHHHSLPGRRPYSSQERPSLAGITLLWWSPDDPIMLQVVNCQFCPTRLGLLATNSVNKGGGSESPLVEFIYLRNCSFRLFEVIFISKEEFSQMGKFSWHMAGAR